MPLYSPPWCLRPPWKPAPSGEPPSRTFRTAVNSLSSRYDSNRACKFRSSLPSDCKVIQDISQFDRSLCVQIKYLAYGPISGGRLLGPRMIRVLAGVEGLAGRAGSECLMQMGNVTAAPVFQPHVSETSAPCLPHNWANTSIFVSLN